MADVDKKNLYIIGGVVLGLILLFGVLYYTTDLFKAPAGEGTFEELAAEGKLSKPIKGFDCDVWNETYGSGKSEGISCNSSQLTFGNVSLDSDRIVRPYPFSIRNKTIKYTFEMLEPVGEGEPYSVSGARVIIVDDKDYIDITHGYTDSEGKKLCWYAEEGCRNVSIKTEKNNLVIKTNGLRPLVFLNSERVKVLDVKNISKLKSLKNIVFLGRNIKITDFVVKPVGFKGREISIKISSEDTRNVTTDDIIKELPLFVVRVGETFETDVDASMKDGASVNFTYSINLNWLPIANTSGEISWVATEDKVDNYTIEVSATTDNTTETAEFVLEVKEKAVCGDGNLNKDEECELNQTKTCAEYIGSNCNGTVTCGAPDVCTWDASACTCTCEGDKPPAGNWSECEEGEQTRPVAECDTSTGEWKMTGTETKECGGLGMWWIVIILGIVLLLGGGFSALWYFYLGPNDMLLGSKYDDWFGRGYSSLKTPSPPSGKSSLSKQEGTLAGLESTSKEKKPGVPEKKPKASKELKEPKKPKKPKKKPKKPKKKGGKKTPKKSKKKPKKPKKSSKGGL